MGCSDQRLSEHFDFLPPFVFDSPTFSMVENRIYLNPTSSRWTILNYHSAPNWKKIICSVLTLNIISSLFKQRICSDELQFVRSPCLSCFDFLCLLTLPVAVVLLGFCYFSFSYPSRSSNAYSVWYMVWNSFLYSPPRGSNTVRFDIWFEIPSFTHLLEVVMLFGLLYGLKFLPLFTP